MNRGVVALVFAIAFLVADAAHAQVVVPQSTPHAADAAARTTAVVGAAVGIERFGPPTVTVALSPTTAPLTTASAGLLLVGRFDTASRTIAVGGGGQFVQPIAGGLFAREALVVTPFVSALGTVVGGVRGEATAQLGWRCGDDGVVDIVVGPRITPVLAVAVPTDGRLGIDLAGGLRWHVLSELLITAELAAGADFAHRDFELASNVLAGEAMLGLQWSPR